jgi:outer membrane receptor for ferric coprogen and ferric-rhodotorulic acid
LSALQAGFAAPGDLINYVTKRPAAEPVNDLHLSATQDGNAKLHADLSRRSEDGRFGVRLNAALEEERSHVRKIDGDRQFLALAADWRVTPDTLLQMDVEHERRDQTAQPDLFADVNGRLPSGFNPRTFLGQSWATYPTEDGLEVALTGKLGREWTVFGSAMLLDTELKDTGDPATRGKRPAGVPRHRVALTVEYSPQRLPAWTFAGNWTHTGNRPLDAANTGDFAPAYNVFGFGARYVTRFGGTTATLRVNVDNLFDKHYWAGAQYGQLTAGVPRTVSASASFRF